MPRVADAVQAARGGVALAVEVVPGAAGDAFPAGFNAWRGRLEARVTAPPEKGAANAALARLVAAFFDVPPQAAAVTAGHTARRKTVTVTGVTPAVATARLDTALGGGA